MSTSSRQVHSSALSLGLLLALLPALALSCQLPLEVPVGARIACAAGEDCPAAYACLVAEARCVSPGAACVDVDAANRTAVATDGARCTTADGEAGVCRSGQCGGACGDGVVDASAGELCDLGELNSDDDADGCRSDCLPARCGDGVVDRGESCDDDGDTCDACLAVCALESADLDDDAGCEAPLAPTDGGDGFLVQASFVDDGGLPSVVYASITGDDNEIRRLDLDSGADTLVVTCPDFCRPIAGPRAVAFVSGTFAEVYVVRNGNAVLLFDGSSEQAMSAEGLYVLRTDGESEFLSRTDLSTLAETRLDDDVDFPPALAVTPTRVVWTPAGGGLAARPLGGGPREDFAAEIIGPSRFAADGDDLWVLDDFGDLWLIDADNQARRVLERPGALAGTRADSVAVRGGTWAVTYFFNGANFDDTDDVGSLLVGDASGAHAMRARTNDSFSGVYVGGDVVLLAGAAIYSVPR